MAAETDEKCQAAGVITSISGMLGSISTMHNSIANIELYSRLIADYLKELRDIMVHYHNGHLHPRMHLGQEDFSKDYGMAFIPDPILPSDKLIEEYNTNMDVDNNGLIYGKDFKLKGSDVPRSVASVNDLIDDNSVKQQLSLNQYIATIPNGEKIWHL